MARSDANRVKIEHWLLLILAFLLGALGQVPRPNNQSPSQAPETQSQNEQSQGNSIAPQSDGNDGNADSKQGQGSGRLYDFTLTDIIQSVFTGVLVVVAILQIILMSKQSALMDRQNESTRKQAEIMSAHTVLMNRQTEAMDKQTEYMENGIELTRISTNAASDALLARRAFVVFDRIDLTTRIAPKDLIEELVFDLKWVNAGDSIARAVIAIVEHVRCEGGAGLPDGFNYPTPMTKRPAIQIIPPRGTAMNRVKLSSEIIMDVVGGKARHFFYGWSAYRDIFEDTPIHITEFCRELHYVQIGKSGLHILARDQKLSVAFFTWHEYNASDQDCDDYEEKVADYHRFVGGAI